MATNYYRALRGALTNAHYSATRLCDLINVSRSSLSRKINGKVPFDMDEAYKILDALRIPHSKLSYYFPAGGMYVDPTLNSTMLDQIHSKCLECKDGNSYNVLVCNKLTCPLSMFRMGGKVGFVDEGE